MFMTKDYGNKYVCFNCAAKFYNMGKPKAICPICDTDQNKRPKRKERKTLRNYETDNRPNEKKTDMKEHEKAVLEEMETPLLDKEIGDGETIKTEDEEE
jgi:hypothetical protein